MKKSGNKNILYAVWGILCAATAFLGGFSHSMLINYAFLAVMGLLILIVDRHGLSKICRITKDLKGITETFSEAEAKGTQGNEAYLSWRACTLHTRKQKETGCGFRRAGRVQTGWIAMWRTIFLRVNFWNPVITMCVRRWPVF